MSMKEIIGKFKWYVKVLIHRKLFPFWQSLGFHLTRVNYYQPIPDTRQLKEDLWMRPSPLVGIQINEEKQVALLSEFMSRYKSEYDAIPMNASDTSNPYQYYFNNEAFPPVDGEILYCMIRYFKPKTLIEIGSGNTTLLSAQAILKNKSIDGHECTLHSIEPYPNEKLKKGFPGLSRLIAKRVQDIPLSEFDVLQENDILFIDSSHVLAIGSDVQYEYLEILPRLAKGVIVHAHDIFIPAEYPRDFVLRDYHFWTEQYLLQAFLTYNDHFEILWGSSFMYFHHKEKLSEAFKSYKGNLPASFWIRKIK